MDVARAAWFDSAVNQQKTELFNKEDKWAAVGMRQDYAKELADLEREEAEAKAAAEAAAADATQEGEEEWVGGRETVDPSTLSQWERDNRMTNQIGANMWRTCNPAYDARSMNTTSVTKAEFTYDPEEIEPVDKTHFRRRDKFTFYVEAAAKSHNLAKASAKEAAAE
ncbi:flagellar associated protein [Micromonas commoda]|uniref:Flagellar associated protein n=1 Tax=Micromonas commoda (strain RCC299 / NOUM17 / CCMP2709) TaxID=296587 RepID=C1E260_MICCC|nr:flagellar associated protein [Micromonas commoda]ACO62284.1 flagellar associated protein [Micromonas commoda]|mmetsp:Transcript_6750/g.29716  ORF Transcript_6750/g.29716 Transcript_6750/m.29716 type:complete len:167 (-) Transcript_6750:3190-3690(-)|eukprot:XP_002501026.1 flagellar associated protein [Micromonas commoda]